MQHLLFEWMKHGRAAFIGCCEHYGQYAHHCHCCHVNYPNLSAEGRNGQDWRICGGDNANV